MQVAGILLEGGYGPHGSVQEVGVFAFMVACVAVVLCPVFLLIALIMNLSREKGTPKTRAQQNITKLGLVSLVVAGIGFLLTAALCSG